MVTILNNDKQKIVLDNKTKLEIITDNILIDNNIELNNDLELLEIKNQFNNYLNILLALILLNLIDIMRWL
jgi:hypothetical protein